jgi:hypothetical protein
MIKWTKMLSIVLLNKDHSVKCSYWKKEAIESICELYYMKYKNTSQKSILLKKNIKYFSADYFKFLETHIRPLEKYNIWDALFPNIKSILYANALDEALRLVADTKLIDRIYTGDLSTVKKIVFAIRKKRAKYLNMY